MHLWNCSNTYLTCMTMHEVKMLIVGTYVRSFKHILGTSDFLSYIIQLILITHISISICPLVLSIGYLTVTVYAFLSRSLMMEFLNMMKNSR